MLRIIEKHEPVKQYGSVNAEHFVCVVVDELNSPEPYNTILHKSEVDLILNLNAIAKSLFIQPMIMNEIWKKIEDFGQYKYESGGKDMEDSMLEH